MMWTQKGEEMLEAPGILMPACRVAILAMGSKHKALHTEFNSETFSGCFVLFRL